MPPTSHIRRARRMVCGNAVQRGRRCTPFNNVASPPHRGHGCDTRGFLNAPRATALLVFRVLARIEAGREASLDATRLILDEVDQRPDLFLRQLSPPRWHLPAVALPLDLPVV